MDTGIYTGEKETTRGDLQQWAKEQAIKAGPSQLMAIIWQDAVQQWGNKCEG